MKQQSTPVRILVIDDDDMSREVLCVLLQGEGYQVDHADSGERALLLLGEDVSAGRALPRLVLSDVQMPGLAGAELARELHKVCGAATLLLAMSGSGADEDEVSGFDGFVLKPFSLREISAALRAHQAGAPLPNSVSPRKKGRGNPDQLALLAASESSTARLTARPGYASNEAMSAPLQHAHFAIGTAGEPPLPAGDILDEKIYGQLASAMPRPQLHQMYAMCVNDARERIAAMRREYAQGDSVRFMRDAHSIKGGCGMLGARELYGLAAGLEASGFAAAGLQGGEDVNPLDELSAACDRLERILGSRV